MPGKRIRYTQVPNGIVTFDLLFPAVLLLPHLIFHLLCRGQGGRALNYQLSTGPPTKSNRNYEPVTRPGGLVRSPLFLLPRSLLLPFPPYGDLFRTCTRMKNNARIGEVCHQAAGTLHIREAEHTWAPRGAARRGSIPERSGLSEPAGPKDEAV